MDPIVVILIILVIIALFGAPVWGHSREWGYGPSGIVGLLILIILILVLTGNLHIG